MRSLQDTLLEVVEQEGWPEQEKELGRKVAEDLALLTTRKLLGEDVDAEMAMAFAAAQNITVAAGISAASAFADAAKGFLAEVITELFTQV